MTDVSIFNNLQDNTEPAVQSWGEYFPFLKTGTFPIESDKKDSMPCFVPALFAKSGSRKKDNIQAVTGVVLDVDKASTLEEVRALITLLKALELECLIHSTYSTDENSIRLRLVFPLLKHLPVETFEKLKIAARLASKLQLDVDPVSFVPTQVYYLPSCPESKRGHFFLELIEGERLDPATLPLLPVQHKSQKAGHSRSEEADDDAASLARKICAFSEGGVAPIYTKAGWSLYVSGVWPRFGVDEFRSWAFNDVFEQRQSVANVNAALNWLQAANYRNAMPPATHDYLANIGGVTVDLRTHEVVENSPDNYITNFIPHAYEPSATCPRFDQFLNEILLGDPEAEAKRRHLQEWFGYLMMHTTKLQKMLILYGSGANGKSIITAVLIFMLGEDNVASVPLAELGGRFATSDLNGKLANIVDEIGIDAGLPDGKLKDLIGGGRVRAEFKGKDAFTFHPKARMVVSTNHLPPTRDSGHGFFRRLLILALLRRFEPHEQDPNLLDALKAEMSGILNFAIEGAARLISQGGFTEVPSSALILEEYANEANSVKRFADQALEVPGRCDPDTGKPFKTRSQLVFRAYVRFCSETNARPVGDVKFGKMLKELGVERIKSNGATYYNVQLQERWRWLSDDSELERELKRVEGPVPAATDVPRMIGLASDEFGAE